jgi:hypothetical protein
MVEFADHPPYSGTGARFSRLLKEKMSGSTDGIDTVIVRPGEVGINRSDRMLGRGRISLKTLELARQRFGGGSIMIGEITDYDPYSGPSVGVQFKIFSTSDASLLTSVSDRWNAASPEVLKAVRRFYRRNRGRDECRFGPNMFLTSPRYFLVFVADRIVNTHLFPGA